MSRNAPPPVPPGDPKRIDDLLAAEARLEVSFPESCRAYIADPKRHTLGVKRVRIFPVSRCEWLESEEGVVIGEDWNDSNAGLQRLVFKLRRGRKPRSDVVYAYDGSRFRRVPRFSEFIARERNNPTVSRDDRVRLAQRLTGVCRRCSRCGNEIRIAETCTCGRIGDTTDPAYTLSADERAEAEAAQPSVVAAWSALTALKRGGDSVPLGPVQVVRLAQLLDDSASHSEAASALIAAWKSAGLRTTVEPSRLVEELRRAGSVAP